MINWQAALSCLADGGDLSIDASRGVSFVRHDEIFQLQIRNEPAMGPSVFEINGISHPPIPIASYIQGTLLRLPRLAKQVAQRTNIIQTGEDRPLKYFINGPAQLREFQRPDRRLDNAKAALRELLERAPSLGTHIIQIVSDAGFGKTTLLEEVAHELAGNYIPHEFPTPIVVPIDLLGRNIGTIDDAIAGSLVNTYGYHGLNQKDISLCIEHRWIVLALDGFDELVARVGPREAFQKLAELVEGFDGGGSLILSARANFFEQSEIANAISSYFVLKRGSYLVTTMELLPWTELQCHEALGMLGSKAPSEDFQAISKELEDDQAILFHPFFITRLARIWISKGSFQEATWSSEEEKVSYWLTMFIKTREGKEKWVDRQGRPLISDRSHEIFLGQTAAEMWQVGTFSLEPEYIQLVAEIAANEIAADSELTATIREKSVQHAAFVRQGRKYAFLHSKFFNYYLGARVAQLAASGDKTSLRQLLNAREMSPEMVRWAAWSLTRSGIKIESWVSISSDLRHSDVEIAILRQNSGRIISQLLLLQPKHTELTIEGEFFLGIQLSKQTIADVTFRGCRFTDSDWSSARFTKCNWGDCALTNIRIDSATAWENSEFSDSSITGLILGQKRFYDPHQAALQVQRSGAKWTSSKDVPPTENPRVKDTVLEIIDSMVEMTNRCCDITIQETIEKLGDDARPVIRAGLSSGVFRKVAKGAAGNDKDFFRFNVSKGEVLSGATKPSRNDIVEAFWKILIERFPSQE